MLHRPIPPLTGMTSKPLSAEGRLWTNQHQR